MLDEISRVYFGTNKIIHLSERETQLLAILIENKDGATPINEIAKRIYTTPPKNPILCVRRIIYGLKKKVADEIQITSVPSKSYKIKYIGKDKNFEETEK